MHYHMIWILFNLFVGCLSTCTTEYGRAPSCVTYLPAPPGKTPQCARPGQTYCEHPEHYPVDVIHHLIQEWRFDHATILSSDTKEDFNTYYYPAPVYGPPNYRPPNTNPPEPIYIPKPQYPLNSFHGPNNAYIPPKFKPAINFTSSVFLEKGYVYQQPPHQFVNYKYSSAPNYYSAPNENWKSRAGQKYQRLSRSLRYRRSLDPITSSNSSVAQLRSKRQSLSGETLCQTRMQYIMPRAALNSKGNWMYVVNMPEVDTTLTQLVKSETCTSQTCSGLCSLPQGYTSRCEQKYVQKKLVALEGGGSQLYNDVFWFPSCCVCTLSNT